MAGLNQIHDRASATSALQMYLLVFLRIAIGWHFLFEGLSKLFTPGWSAAGFLEVSRWLFSGVFHWIADTPAVLKAVDLLNIWGLILIGLALMLGAFTRLAALLGATLLLLYYTANPPLVGLDFGVPTEGNYLWIDKNFVEMIALLTIAAFPTGLFAGLDRWILGLGRSDRLSAAEPDRVSPQAVPKPGARPYFLPSMGRRELVRGLASLPFLGAFAFALFRKKRWESYEEKNLVDAVTSASVKTLNIASLAELKRQVPTAQIKGKPFSRLILGGNLLSGWAHSRDLIYVSQLVKAYHHKDKIFATLLLAEKCGINTLLTNPILCTLIDEYWKRNLGRIQFISDCVGLNYDDRGPHPVSYEEFLTRIKRAIDYGAVACYVQGETADHYIQNGKVDGIAKAIQLIRDNGVIAGIGAHQLETVKACVQEGLKPDFWMKTLHHLNYWSARHPEWHDNSYCSNPEETIAFMETVREPWIAFKVMAAGAIHPRDGFRYAFENGADFVCAGMYDFQMVEDVNLATDILVEKLPRRRNWMLS